MSALPNASVPLFEAAGEAASPLREILSARGTLPRGPLIDANGLALPGFRNFLSGIVTKPLPKASAPLADKMGRPTRVFTLLLAGL